ncbi:MULTISPECIES: hypothetical protein [unclassified Paenibacillus]|uniref:hypothetical protein n=1 Tax=unclassified Paenibacillus TaxID=185978 RepID=UPI0030F7578B
MKQKLIPFLFVLGILVPTSVNREMTNVFVFVGCTVLLVSLVYMLSKQRNIPIKSFYILLFINCLLFIFTFTSPLTEYRFGNSLYFLILSVIFLFDFNSLDINVENFRRSLQIVNLVLIVFSLSVIFNYAPVVTLLHNWFSAFYMELLPNMFAQKKPVSTFGTHSIAGFYYFILFILNFVTYYFLKRKIHLVIGLLFMVFLYYIQSSTSLVYFLVCFLAIAFLLFKKSKRVFFMSMLVLVILVVFKFDDISIFQKVNDKLFSSNNGLSIRYSGNGTLSENIKFISNNPFNGIGYGYSTTYQYVDSGILEYSLRGSVFTLLAVLLGFFLFLRRNLDKSTSIILFLLFLSFEIGFSNLIYFRTLFILPFMVAYLNKLMEKNTSDV